MVEILTKNGANVNTKSKIGGTALQYAAQNGKFFKVRKNCLSNEKSTVLI